MRGNVSKKGLEKAKTASVLEFFDEPEPKASDLALPCWAVKPSVAGATN